MRNETATVAARATLAPEYTYTIVEAQEEIIEAIGQLRAAGSMQLALVTISLAYNPEEKAGQAKISPGKRASQGTAYLLQSMRVLVRKTDRVFLHGHTMYFVLVGANLQGALIVEERLWEALLWRVHNMSEQGVLSPVRLEIGHGALSDSHASPAELLRAAGEISKRFGGRADRPGARGAERGTREEEPTSEGEKEELPLLARKLGIPYLTLLPRKLPRRVQQVVNTRLAQELRCYPIGRERNMLTVAMLNPQDHKALERLRQETGLCIFPVLTHPEVLERALKQLS